MFGYIFMTTNTLNGMRFIGKRSSSEFKPNYLGSGIRLKLAIKYYGRKAFEVRVIAWAKTKEKLHQLEAEYLAMHEALISPEFYNLAEGGTTGLEHLDRRTPQMDRAAERYAELPEMLRTMSQSEIATLLGVHQTAVAKRIREHNVLTEREPVYAEKLRAKRRDAIAQANEARTRKAEDRWAEFDLEEMYQTMTQAEIAKAVGVSQVAVSQRLKRLRSG